MDKYILTSNWYQLLLEQVNATMTEAIFNHNWALVEGYHKVGESIVLEAKNRQIALVSLVTAVSRSLNKSYRTIYRACQFYEKYPDLAYLPEGKDTNWHKIVNKYLTNGTQKKKVTTCPYCHKSW